MRAMLTYFALLLALLVIAGVLVVSVFRSEIIEAMKSKPAPECSAVTCPEFKCDGKMIASDDGKVMTCSSALHIRESVLPECVTLKDGMGMALDSDLIPEDDYLELLNDHPIVCEQYLHRMQEIWPRRLYSELLVNLPADFSQRDALREKLSAVVKECKGKIALLSQWHSLQECVYSQYELREPAH